MTLSKRILYVAIAIMWCAAAPLAGAVSLDFSSPGIFTGTIAAGGVYRIALIGGDGGNASNGPSAPFGGSGGRGGLVVADIELFAGQSYSVVVGGNGGNAIDRDDQFGGGGGGGLSLFTTQDLSLPLDPNQTLAVAGGGGGGTAGLNNIRDGQPGGQIARIDGLGGTAAASGAGGGAGILGPGENSGDADDAQGGASAPTFIGGAGWENLGQPGNRANAGGFGGGGGGGFFEGGGGGGFSGGNGGAFRFGVSSIGNGGGSFVSSDFINAVLTRGDRRTDPDQTATLSLELISPSQIPVPGAALLFSSALCAGLLLRRKQTSAQNG